MKKAYYQFLIQLFFILIAMHIKADSIQDLKQNLSSSDPSARASAMEHFVISLGTVNGETLIGPAMPV